MRRFVSPLYILGYQPRPGERESRFRTPKDRTMNRPREENDHV